MPDKLLEFVGIAAASAAIVMVAENNIPAIRNAVSRLVNIPPSLTPLLKNLETSYGLPASDRF